MAESAGSILATPRLDDISSWIGIELQEVLDEGAKHRRFSDAATGGDDETTTDNNIQFAVFEGRDNGSCETCVYYNTPMPPRLFLKLTPLSSCCAQRQELCGLH